MNEGLKVNSAGMIDFKRQNLTSVDVRLWRLNSISSHKNMSDGRIDP